MISKIIINSQYGNAVQDDLWEAFTQQAKVNKISLPATVKQIMDSWTLKMGSHECVSTTPLSRIYNVVFFL